METLLNDGVTITDPGRICRLTTVHFTHWFTPKFPKAIPQWLLLLTNHDYLYEHARAKNIPDEHTDVIWQALSYRPPDTPRKADFIRTVRAPPTYDRFIKAIRQAPKNTAGGISGLTYDHMRYWSVDVVKSIYAACCDLWITKSVPVEWTRRWVHLIPKAPDPTLDELRPICLLEVTRKLWVGLVNH